MSQEIKDAYHTWYCLSGQEGIYNSFESGYKSGHASRDAEVAALKADNEQLRIASGESLMAMSEEQIQALCRLQGHNPDDEALITKQVFEIAALKSEIENHETTIRLLSDQCGVYQEEIAKLKTDDTKGRLNTDAYKQGLRLEVTK